MAPAEPSVEQNPPPNSQQPQSHPRDLACDAAVRELLPWINEWRQRHGLSTAEFVWVMLQPLGAYARQLGIHDRHREEMEQEARRLGVR